MGGSLTENEMNNITNRCNIKNTNFVETGTYKGDTTKLASKCFDNVFTIEFVEKLYNEAKENCRQYKNIQFLLGDSQSVLPFVSSTLVGDTTFFLDAHISGPDTSYSKIYVPLMEEFDIIMKNYKHDKLVIIVDDIRFFNCKDEMKPHDWAHISLEKLRNKVNENGWKIEDEFFSEFSDRYIFNLINFRPNN